MQHDIRSVTDGRVLLDLPSVWVFLGTVGDLDGDGRTDLLVRLRSRELHVLSGLDGTSLAVLDEEWRAHGGQGGEPVHLTNCAPLGDVDRDGVPDFAAVQLDTALWLVSGRTTSIVAAFPAEQIFSGFGRSLEPIGDVDGDGAVDLMIGTPSHDDLGAALDYGQVAVVSGRTGRQLRSFQGDRERRYLGERIASLGDLDGDGLAEVGVSVYEELHLGRGSLFRIYRGRDLR
jgi:hypothetical protein